MRITVCDVGPRDGLQNEAETLSPPVRAELCNRLAATGLPRVEAASFVRAERVPQMAGAEEVVAALDRSLGAEFAGLVLNAKGAERLAATALDRLHFTLAATETFNERNAGRSIADSLAALDAIETDLPLSVSISVSFGCPFEGRVDPGQVLDLAERCVAAGAEEIVFADTIGVAVPRQVRALVTEGARRFPPVGGHFHDTRNTGIASAAAALEAGATVLDASVGGLGGCPFAPRATGNVATEDLLYLLDGEGVETGVDLDAVIGVTEWLAGVLGKSLPGRVSRAGPFRPVPA